jgi:hypothetical protein
LNELQKERAAERTLGVLVGPLSVTDSETIINEFHAIGLYCSHNVEA